MGRARPPAFDDAARARLHHHDWPGNVRQLRSVVEGAVLLADSDLVTARVLVRAGLPADVPPPPPGESACDAERDRVITALAECGGNQSRAARALGMSRNTLIARIEKFGLVRPRRQDDLR
jgi:two-component system NtrC family response regulator